MYKKDITTIHVSVLMPNYNTEKFLPEAIESILNQTHKNLELIIVDDCSTDNSWKIIKSYASKDARIKIFRNKENQGTVSTRNKLFRKVSPRSVYIALLDSDDVAGVQRIREQVLFLENNNNIALCGSNIGLIDEESLLFDEKKYQTDPKKIKDVILHFNPIAQSTVMMRTDAQKEIGDYDTSLSRVEDYDYWIRFILHFDIANIDKVLVMYRIHNGQGKYKRSSASFWYSFIVRKRYVFMPEFFSVKALAIMIAYLFAVFIPARIMIFLYKNIFV